ncbi:hypothetical protein Tco_1058766 [Tanacetum coccineum]|uniref:Uncharacterized protein n=1 Tax=Tanacetum coccineum TaxID=301880 RepID=A0ABQ5HA09_9ASTR
MVWSGHAVLMPGKTNSIIKLNNNSGCLPGSTFVYSEVFKLDFSSASTHLKSSLIPILAFSVNILLDSIFMNYGVELTAMLDSITYKQIKIYRQKINVVRIMSLAAVGLAELRRCWYRQSSA